MKVQRIESSCDYESHNLSLISQQVYPKLSTYFVLWKEVERNACYFQPGSELSTLRRNIESKIEETRNILGTLNQHKNMLSEGQSKLSTLAKKKFLSVCHTSISETEENLTKCLMDLNDILPKMIRKLQKRKSNLNVKASNKRPIDIICLNAHKSWSECMEEILGDDRFNLKTFTHEDFDKTKQFFDWLVMSGNEFCYIEELLTRLNKSSEDKNYVEKILLENLPLIKLTLDCSVSILIDTEVLLTSPNLLFTVMKMSKSRTVIKQPRTPIKFSRPVKKQRVPGSGR